LLKQALAGSGYRVLHLSSLCILTADSHCGVSALATPHVALAFTLSNISDEARRHAEHRAPRRAQNQVVAAWRLR
jgi:hypothetical protein